MPTNFWQLKSVHSLAIRVGEAEAMVSRGYKSRQMKKQPLKDKLLSPSLYKIEMCKINPENFSTIEN